MKSNEKEKAEKKCQVVIGEKMIDVTDMVKFRVGNVTDRPIVDREESENKEA